MGHNPIKISCLNITDFGRNQDKFHARFKEIFPKQMKINGLKYFPDRLEVGR